ncbi:MAG: hypothetical protein IPM63_05135 [Acidobacteriota bacterium]|nr:MAG: hypothetical protein IPM63_05135 [Acidobacteriota bacterium]
MRTQLIVFFSILLALSCSRLGENTRAGTSPEPTANANIQTSAVEETGADAINPNEKAPERPSPTVPDFHIRHVNPDRDGWQVLVPKRKEPGNVKESYVPDGRGGKIRKVVRSYSSDGDVVFKLPENRTGLPQLDDLFQVGTVMEIGAEDSVYAYTLFIRGFGADEDPGSDYEHSRSHSIALQIVDREGNGRFIRHYGGEIKVPDWVLREKD